MALVSKKLTIVNKLGMHARAAALFVKKATSFDSEIYVTKAKSKINGKSIMGLLMLAAGKGSEILVEADGEDAQAAIGELEKLIQKGFYEKD